ncbi:MAG: 50S ribosomal protein L15 [Anaerolineales bacterium]|jgi:large subunit ribosomal protein L15
MKLHEIKPRPGSRRSRKRVGRGISAGQGKTAGRGTKGQKSRSGWGGKLYHQGGNLPFYRRLPFKRGFTNINRIEWHEVNLARLGVFKKGAKVNPESLVKKGLLPDTQRPVVILGHGDIKVPLEVKAHRASPSAKAKIEAAGGSLEILEL